MKNKIKGELLQYIYKRTRKLFIHNETEMERVTSPGTLMYKRTNKVSQKRRIVWSGFKSSYIVIRK